jgi:hypothetical protein
MNIYTNQEYNFPLFFVKKGSSYKIFVHKMSIDLIKVVNFYVCI